MYGPVHRAKRSEAQDRSSVRADWISDAGGLSAWLRYVILPAQVTLAEIGRKK